MKLSLSFLLRDEPTLSPSSPERLDTDRSKAGTREAGRSARQFLKFREKASVQPPAGRLVRRAYREYLSERKEIRRGRMFIGSGGGMTETVRRHRSAAPGRPCFRRSQPVGAVSFSRGAP